MLHHSKIIEFFLDHGDQLILLGLGLLFLLWIASRSHVWFPWFVHHPVGTDILIILGSAFFILSPLTQFGAPGGHDFYFHISRVAEVSWLFEEGYYYGRWTPDFNYGFGYPLLNFYPPLVYYLAQTLRTFGVSVLDSLNWVVASGVWLSGIFMYLLGKEFWGRYGGVVCAVAYMYAPYRIVTLYVRGAIPEFYAMTFMPLIFWSFYKILQTKRLIYIVIGAISYGLIIPAHNVTAIFFTLCLIGYSAFLSFDERMKGRKFRVKDLVWNSFFTNGGLLAITSALGIGLVAIYWLPAMYEKQFVQVSSLHTGYHDVAVHFVHLPQFFSRFWGYGGSGPGPNDGMSFQLGTEHLLLAGVSIAMALFLKRTPSRQRKHVIFSLLLILSLIFAMTSASLVIWRTVPLIGFISFPWRLLSITAFALSFLCGGVFLVNFDRYFSRWRSKSPTLSSGNRMVQFILIGMLLGFTVGYCRPGGLLPFSDERLSRESLRDSSGAAMNNEYLPIWSEKHPIKDPKPIKGGEIQIISGNADIHNMSTNMLSYQFTIEATTPATLRIGTVYFPGWHAYMDEQPIVLEAGQLTGLLTFSVPEGKHSLDIRFEDTVIRIISRYISLGTLVILCTLMIVHYAKRKI